MTLPLKSLARGIWWLVVVRGILAIIFGIIALIAPDAALTGIAIVFGAYALVDGIMAIVHAVRTRKAAARWGWLLVQGVISLAAGLTALIFPGIAALFGGLFVIWTIVFYSVMHGAAGIASAAGAETGRARTWGVAGGVLTLVFGVLLAILTFVTPGATILGLIWTVGIYAILFGVMLIIVGIQLRRGLVALGI
jgi:uncharacterized membrane protein HdeD (DUF308 family)